MCTNRGNKSYFLALNILFKLEIYKTINVISLLQKKENREIESNSADLYYDLACQLLKDFTIIACKWVFQVVVHLRCVSEHFLVAQLPSAWVVAFHMLQPEFLSSHEISISPSHEHPRTTSLSILSHATGFCCLMLTPPKSQSTRKVCGYSGQHCVLRMMGKRGKKQTEILSSIFLNFSGGKPFVADTVMQKAEL